MTIVIFKLTLSFLKDGEEFFWKNIVDIVRIVESVISVLSLQIIQINIVTPLVMWRTEVLRHRIAGMDEEKEDTHVH